MKITNKIGVILLAAYLILSGLIALLKLSFQGMDLVLGLLAIVGGCFLLVDR